MLLNPLNSAPRVVLSTLVRSTLAERQASTNRRTAKASTAYQDFLTIRKAANPDIPILVAAKSEQAELE